MQEKECNKKGQRAGKGVKQEISSCIKAFGLITSACDDN